MANESFISELLKSNLCRNTLIALAENKPVDYSTIESVEDGIKIAKAILEDRRRDILNRYEQHNVARVKLLSDFINKLDHGASNLTFEQGYALGLYIAMVLSQATCVAEMKCRAINLNQLISNSCSLTPADRNNLSLVISYLETIYEEEIIRGRKYGC